MTPTGTAGMSRLDKLALKRELAEAMLEAGLSLNDTTSPGQLAMKHEPGLQVSRPHLEAIDEALTGLLAHPNRRLMIFTPPQIGKSTRVSRWFPFWWLTMRPKDRIILGSYAASLAQTHGAAVRDLIETYGAEYGLRLHDTQRTKSDWMLRMGGGLRARGVKGGITGQSMDLGIIDDPIAGREQAESVQQRNALWDWYSSAWSSRRSPQAREVLVCTRWHKDDLAGRLLDQDGRVEEGGEWHVLHIPAIALAPDHEKGVFADPLGREPGEPVTHPRIDDWDTEALLEHWTRARQAATERDWNALYQGLPFDAKGALLTSEDVRKASAVTTQPFRRTVVGVDPSGGGRDTAGIVAGALDDLGKVWWIADRSAHMDSFAWPLRVCELANEVEADRIVVETNFGGDQATTLVRQAWAQLQRDGQIPANAICPLITAVTARKSKVLRAEPISQAVKTGRLGFAVATGGRYVADDMPQLKLEWQQWEPGTTWSPGALDAAVYVATELLPPIARDVGTFNPAKVRRDTAVVAARGPAGRRIAR